MRPVHVELLGELLQLRQVVHAALDGYADEIQLGVALVNIHEFGNDGDARLAPCPPEVEQGVIAAEFDGFALDVLCGNGRGAEAFVGCGRRGRVGKRCDADAALLTAEIDVDELENQVVADDGELYFAQQILLYKLSCQFVVVRGYGVCDGELRLIVGRADLIVLAQIVEIANEEIVDSEHGDEFVERQRAGHCSAVACNPVQTDSGCKPDVGVTLGNEVSFIFYLFSGKIIVIIVRKVSVVIHVKRTEIRILLHVVSGEDADDVYLLVEAK